MSTLRLTLLAGVALLAVIVAAGTANATKADPPMGQQAFTDLGRAQANGSLTGDINTATTFTVDELTSTSNQAGIFVGMPHATSATFTFNSTVANSLDIFNSVFGKFVSTSIFEIDNKPSVVGFGVIGMWTPGSFFHFGAGPFKAFLTISFTQTPAHFGLISDSATFSIPVPRSVTPEPPSAVLVLTGLLVGVGIYGFRRHRHPLVTA